MYCKRFPTATAFRQREVGCSVLATWRLQVYLTGSQVCHASVRIELSYLPVRGKLPRLPVPCLLHRPLAISPPGGEREGAEDPQKFIAHFRDVDCRAAALELPFGAALV